MDAEFCMKFIGICIGPINLRLKNVYKWTVSFRHIDTNDEMKMMKWKHFEIKWINEKTRNAFAKFNGKIAIYKKQIALWEKSISLQVNKMNAVNSWSDYGKLWWNDPNQSGSWVLKMILSLTKQKTTKMWAKGGRLLLILLLLVFFLSHSSIFS